MPVGKFLWKELRYESREVFIDMALEEEEAKEAIDEVNQISIFNGS